MAFLRRMKAIVFVFMIVALVAGGFSIMTTEDVQASGGCCIWVMYCTTTPPIYCWCECIPCPSFP